MKITLYGAAGGEVTGSAYLLQTDRANVLVDCGLFQGSKKLENSNRLPRRGPLQRLDSVVLTHAHLDHTGRLPLLTRFDYSGPIYATPASIALAELILKDSAYLQGEDAKRQNRQRAEAGKPLIEPLYTQKEVDRLHPLFRRLRYDHPTVVAPKVITQPSGHAGGCDSLCQAKCQATWQRGGLPNVQACYRKWSRLNANPDLARACEYKSREEQRRLGCGL